MATLRAALREPTKAAKRAPVSMSASAASRSPATTESNPDGSPSRSAISTARTAGSTARSDGFHTTALPASSASKAMVRGSASAAFHGENSATTPCGR